MDRRQFLDRLGVAGVGGLAALAGCGSPDSDRATTTGTSTPTATSPPNATPPTTAASPTATESPADGETPTGTATETEAASDSTASETPTGSPGSGTFSITSPAFADGGSIPSEYTCSGADVSPRLDISGPPETAETLALVVDDPDAPTADPFVHWLLWNVPATIERIPRGVAQTETVSSLDGARQGTNGFGEIGYRGPCPPRGDGPHTYRFTLSALDERLDVSAGARRTALASEIQRTEITRTRLTGEFQRSESVIHR